MTDFRKLESELHHLLDAAGLDIVNDGGDLIMNVAPIACQYPGSDRCNVDPRGICKYCGERLGQIEAFSITRLAQRLADFFAQERI